MKSQKVIEIKLPPLVEGRLVRRYKRFLADVELADGMVVTAHCPNSGRMTGCRQPGRPVYLSQHDNPRRKLKYSWELIDMPDSLVGINTLLPNRLVQQAVHFGAAETMEGYADVAREVTVAKGSRLDLLATAPGRRPCYIEVKNCTLVEEGIAMFPDAVTARGKKHLIELGKLVSTGNRCVMFFLVQRMDADTFSPAHHIDPGYARELRIAHDTGVEILVYDVSISLEAIRLNRKLPFRL